jgi:hypothetical protein
MTYFGIFQKMFTYGCHEEELASMETLSESPAFLFPAYLSLVDRFCLIEV